MSAAADTVQPTRPAENKGANAARVVAYSAKLTPRLLSESGADVYNGFRGMSALMDDLALLDQAGVIARTTPSESDLEMLKPDAAERVAHVFRTSLPTRLAEAVKNMQAATLEVMLYFHVLLRAHDIALATANVDAPLPGLSVTYRLHHSQLKLVGAPADASSCSDDDFVRRLASRLRALADSHPTPCKWKLCPGCALMGLHCACDDVEEPDEVFTKHTEQLGALRERAVVAAKALAAIMSVFVVAATPREERVQYLADTLHRHGDPTQMWLFYAYAAIHVGRAVHEMHQLERIAELASEECYKITDLVESLGAARNNLKSVMKQTTGDALAALVELCKEIHPGTDAEALVVLFQRTLGRSAGRLAVA
jgi:hypothetical protein